MGDVVRPGVLSHPVLGVKRLAPVHVQAHAANVAALQAGAHSIINKQATCMPRTGISNKDALAKPYRECRQTYVLVSRSASERHSKYCTFKKGTPRATLTMITPGLQAARRSPLTKPTEELSWEQATIMMSAPAAKRSMSFHAPLSWSRASAEASAA